MDQGKLCAGHGLPMSLGHSSAHFSDTFFNYILNKIKYNHRLCQLTPDCFSTPSPLAQTSFLLTEPFPYYRYGKMSDTCFSQPSLHVGKGMGHILASGNWGKSLLRRPLRIWSFFLSKRLTFEKWFLPSVFAGFKPTCVGIWQPSCKDEGENQKDDSK